MSDAVYIDAENYSPKSPGNAWMAPEALFHGRIMAEKQLIPRKKREILGDPEASDGFHPLIRRHPSTPNPSG
ncbi:hypothetical protein [Streptomyces sp. AK08-02]|uniref:hypothetical protein n=1 Tax=Streptomyces sp. AK08-02 TaxID=3028654 RepID=UPI0029A8EBD6|nr:hypothetical protein [Streptomyces sp. AK08-02]MDX3751182.1 hypothetical protein [Streptomyces sp. AK08-02]